ncbi:MAG: hypothetical protein H5T74_06200 [Actinobacteria bacterium]|nr:hypothetical protein [Actinomycetota bacterium]MDI6831998.1 CARDB domain-containing protein [Actinomycetota bacterium]
MYAQVRGPKFSRRRRNPAPAIIVAIVVLILGCWLFNLTCGKGGKEVSTSALTEYVNRVRPIIDTSTSVGSGWNAIRSSLAQLVADPDGLNQQLTGVEQSCLDLLEQAKAIEAPEGLGNAHAALLICLEQRYRGAKTFRSDLVNSLNAVDLDVYARSISEDLQELMHSDGSYRFYRRAVTEALEKSGIQDVAPLTDSVWLSDWTNASYENVKAFLTNLRGTEVHGVAVGAVILEPEGKVEEIGGEDIHRLPETEALNITVNVENQGNRAERDVTVTVSLYTERNPAPTRQEQTITSINPGETLQVSFRDLRPTPGVRNILEIKVSPVPQESFLENNQKLIYFTVG